MSEPRSLLKSAGAISFATLVSRILGLARDQVQSYYFGAGAVTDAFVAAFRIPNLLRDLFAEGALSSAFVPTFTSRREKEGAASAWALANRVLSVVAVILGILAVGIAVGAPALLRLYAPGFGPDKAAMATSMTRILSPFLLFIALAAVAMGVLNTCGRFFLPSLAPAWFNVLGIAGVVLLSPLLASAGIEPGYSLALGAMAGGVAQFWVQVPALKREGFRFRFDPAFRDPGVRRVATLMLPATFGLAATQLSILVDTALASYCEDGAITWLSLAFRLMLLPIGLFGVAIATANLARVSRDAARGDLAGLRGNLAAALRTAALLTLPATAGLAVLRVPIVRVLFEHGPVFTPLSSSRTAEAVLCYALGLFAYSVNKVQVPTFYALGDTRWPVVSSAVAVAVKIAVNLAFLAVLPPRYLFLGLALTTSLASWIHLGLLSWGLRRRLGRLAGERLGAAMIKVLFVSAAVAAASGGTHAALEAMALGGAGLAGESLRLAAAVGVGVAVVLGTATRIGIPEAVALRDRVRELARRRGS